MSERSAWLTGAGWIASGPPADAGARITDQSDFDAADQDRSGTLRPTEVGAYR